MESLFVGMFSLSSTSLCRGILCTSVMPASSFGTKAEKACVVDQFFRFFVYSVGDARYSPPGQWVFGFSPVLLFAIGYLVLRLSCPDGFVG